MRKVNLFSIGAMRAGSTTIYNYLEQHPEIFVPHVKEPCFFLTCSDVEKAQKAINEGRKYRTLSAYNSLYSEVENTKKYLGDCSHYLSHPRVANIIYDYNPQAKVIVSLRNPVDRIYSEYLLYVRQNKVSNSFSDFVYEMLIKTSDNKYQMKPICRLRKGLYGQLIEPWLNYFGEDRLKIIFFEDLIGTSHEVCKDIYNWLEVDSTFKPQLVRAQRGGFPRSQLLIGMSKKGNFLRQFLKQKLPLAWRWKFRDLFYSSVLTKEKISVEMNNLLKSLYLEDICQLEELLGKDLSAWK